MMKKIVFLFIFFFLMSIITTSTLAQCPANLPPRYPDGETITSSDGNISIGVLRKYGGAIAYLKDKRFNDTSPAQGKIIDAGQAGALFTTAIWTLPVNSAEQQYCWEKQKQNGLCSSTLPFNNPTQGGYVADGCAGNPNTSYNSVNLQNNRIYVSYRAVNYNYAWNDNGYVTPLTTSNQSQWQTDFYGDLEIYFHSKISDVVVIDTKITYCKQGGCSPITTQDNQLSTLFATGSHNLTDSRFQGPYARAAYRTSQGNTIEALSDDKDDIIIPPYYENWAALLWQNQNQGIGIAIDKYIPLSNEGYHAGKYPSLTAICPNLLNFNSSGITRVIYNNEVHFQFQPGAWYQFRTYVATGTLKDDDPQDLRWKLIRAQDPYYNDGSTNIIPAIHGYIDRITCNAPDIAGWVKDERNPDPHLTVRLEAYPVGEPQNKITRETPVLTTLRPDAGTGAYAFGITLGSLPASFTGKKIRVNIYGISSDGQNLIYYKTSNPIGPCIFLPGDLNNDGKIDIQDFNQLKSDFGKSGEAGFTTADINKDGRVDIFDYNILVKNFGKS